MPPRRSGPQTDDAGVSTMQVEHGIDAVDWLRKHMRGLGLIDCAEALDEAFARCLKAYLEIQDQAVADAASTPADQPKSEIN